MSDQAIESLSKCRRTAIHCFTCEALVYLPASSMADIKQIYSQGWRACVDQENEAMCPDCCIEEAGYRNDYLG